MFSPGRNAGWGTVVAPGADTSLAGSFSFKNAWPKWLCWREICRFARPLAALAIWTTTAFAADPNGDWRVKDGSGVIHIAPCGSAYCGTISWTAKFGRDEHNPDPSKRDHPMVGTQILLEMRPAGDNRWDGQIYNPENGKIYTGHISLIDPNTLRVEGCLLLFCGGENWTRSR